MPLTLSHARGPTEPPLRDITLGELLAWAARTTPERLALIEGKAEAAARRHWTYAEPYREAQRTAHALRALFEPGERVAVWAPNLPEWVMLEFGCAMAGVVLVTVNPAFRAAELQYVLQQSRAAGIFVVDAFRGNPMRAAVQQVAPEFPELRHVVRFDEWAQFVARGNAPGITLPPGRPDGAVWITTMPLFHTGGCVCNVIGAVSVRATQVLIEAFEPGLVLQMIDTCGGAAMTGVPTMPVAMMEHPSFAATDMSHLQGICSGKVQKFKLRERWQAGERVEL